MYFVGSEAKINDSTYGKTSQKVIELIVCDRFNITSKEAQAEMSNMISAWIYDTIVIKLMSRIGYFKNFEL